MRDTYRNAMDHLAFPHTPDYDTLCRSAAHKPRRALRAAAVAACICLLTLVSAFAASPAFRTQVLQTLHIGTAAPDTQLANYTVTSVALAETVSCSYFTLPQGSDAYDFDSGVLFDGQTFYAVTEASDLTPLPGGVVQCSVEWDNFSYPLHFAYGVDGEQLYVRSFADSHELRHWTVEAEAGRTDSVLLRPQWSYDAVTGYSRYTLLRLNLDTLTVTHVADREETYYGAVSPNVAHLEQQWGLQLRQRTQVSETELAYFYQKPIVLLQSTQTGTVEKLDAPEFGTGAAWDGRIYWLGQDSGSVYRLSGRHWETLFTGFDRMEYHPTASGLVVTGRTASGAPAVADVPAGALYQLPPELGSACNVFRAGENRLVITWKDLFQIEHIALLDTQTLQLQLVERRSTGGQTLLWGMLDDQRLTVVSSRTDGNVTVELYTFS